MTIFDSINQMINFILNGVPRVTFGILLMASMLTAANKFWLGNISCIVDGVSGGIMNTYCWIQGTFTVPSQLTGRQGYDHPHPGVGPPTSDLRGPGTYPEKAGPLSSEELLIDNDPNLLGVTEFGDEIRHAWYQWVSFTLCFQALLCYLPHYLWKACERKNKYIKASLVLPIKLPMYYYMI